jgi:hypothetical protein
MYFNQNYEPARKDFWNRDSSKDNTTNPKINSLNYQFIENYASFTIFVRKIINKETIKEFKYEDQLILMNLSLEKVEQVLTSKVLMNDEKVFHEKTEIHFNKKLINFKEMTINELLVHTKTCKDDQKFLSLNLHFSSKLLNLVNKKDLPRISSNFKCNPHLGLLYRKSISELMNLENFSIWNSKGKIEFLIPVNLMGVIIDEMDLQINDQNIQFSDYIKNELFSKS